MARELPVAVLELKLTGEIGEAKAICFSDLRSRLAAVSLDAIHFEINSGGGCAAEAFSMIICYAPNLYP